MYLSVASFALDPKGTMITRASAPARSPWLPPAFEKLGINGYAVVITSALAGPHIRRDTADERAQPCKH
jgi:hypothetical protein